MKRRYKEKRKIVSTLIIKMNREMRGQNEAKS
jgi:hypothetical protein